ncbi:MAG: primosomal protein N', partial [Leptonema sp. (in: Bacteria)]|nr:primosomal protein N' [Leptonema sp. (in: bacteria)]
MIDDPVVTVDQIQLAEWMSNQYLCSVGEALFKMFPSPHRLSQKTKLELRKRSIEAEQNRQTNSNWQMNLSQKLPNRNFTLNVDQTDILKIIEAEISQHKSSIHLIHGITGSGKTEIYIRSIEKALAENKSSILLVPEISLTVQTIDRLQSVFGSELALLHSGRRPKDRFISYNNIIEGHCRVVVGTRSAVFAPVKNLGIIILDEEHDSSYRENSNPRYDARKIAEERCKRNSAVLVLGSATPRVELRYSAEKYDIRKNPNSKARFFYHRLSERAKGVLPEVELLVQQNQIEISRDLLLEIEKNFEAKNQTILLLNRRGYQPYLVCKTCKSTLECKHC